jgi:hypothetical protein
MTEERKGGYLSVQTFTGQGLVVVVVVVVVIDWVTGRMDHHACTYAEAANSEHEAAMMASHVI